MKLSLGKNANSLERDRGLHLILIRLDGWGSKDSSENICWVISLVHPMPEITYNCIRDHFAFCIFINIWGPNGEYFNSVGRWLQKGIGVDVMVVAKSNIT